MRDFYFSFFLLIYLVCFSSCREEIEELTFEDIPHNFKRMGIQSGLLGLDLQLLENGTYELTSTFIGCLVTVIGGKTIGPSSSTCTEGEYEIQNNYLKLIPYASSSNSYVFDQKNTFNIEKHFRILNFDSICYLIDSQDSKGRFDENIWAVNIASKLGLSQFEDWLYLRSDKREVPDKPYSHFNIPDLPFHKKLPEKYQSYLKDTIELNVIDINDSLVTEGVYPGKFNTYITLTLDKGEKAGILKGLWLHPPKEQIEKGGEFFQVSENKITVSKVYPNKCEAHILVKSVKEEEWIKKNAKSYRNKHRDY